ncbi:MAG: hypothetical protein H0T47_08090 [Planctomycetaceae bacterium]|nr:hypothetical protein [Planctomycetaceae bacterium]
MSSVSQPSVVRPGEGIDAFSDGPRTFDYKPVPVMAPVAVFFGILAFFAFLHPAGLPVALVGLVLSALCLLTIRRAAGDYGGAWLARAGLLLSAISLVGGSVLHSVAYANEVPEGHARLNFTQDISKKGFVRENGYVMPHPDVVALEGKQIFLKGYMYPTRQYEGIQAFVFCRDSGDCCFGGTPKVEDMIVVKMAGDQTASFYPGLVSVAGTFELRKELGDERYGEEVGAEPVYMMTATLVEPSRSSF